MIAQLDVDKKDSQTVDSAQYSCSPEGRKMCMSITGSERKSFTIRPYRVDDMSRLYEIDQICFEPGVAYSRAELFLYLAHRNSIAWVAEQSGVVVGFAVGRTEKYGTAHVLTIDVLPDARRLGIGTALLGHLHESFRKHNVRLVVLEVAVQNLIAQRFYCKLGYRVTELIPRYYGNGGDAYRMVLQLSD